MKQGLLTPEDIRSFIFKVAKVDERLTIVQVMKLFHLKYATLMKYIKMGLPWYGVKKRKKFICSEVKAWLAKHTDRSSYEDMLI